MTPDPVTLAPGRTSWRSLPPIALVPLAAVTWWVVGFLPWLLDGLGHDIPRGGGPGPLVLPLFAGNVSALVLGAGLGGVVAGLTVRLGTGSRAQRAGASVGGVALVLVISLLQSRSGVSGLDIDARITNGLSIVVVLVTLVGLGLGLLGVTGKVGLGIALAAVAGAVPVWLMGVLGAVGLADGSQLQHAQELARWAGAVVLAGTLVVVGLRPVRRSAAWIGLVLLAWIIAPTITAAGYMEVFLRPGMGLPDMWGDQLSATADVWRMAAALDARPVTPWIAAIVVAVAAALWLAHHRSLSRPPVP